MQSEERRKMLNELAEKVIGCAFTVANWTISRPPD